MKLVALTQYLPPQIPHHCTERQSPNSQEPVQRLAIVRTVLVLGIFANLCIHKFITPLMQGVSPAVEAAGLLMYSLFRHIQTIAETRRPAQSSVSRGKMLKAQQRTLKQTRVRITGHRRVRLPALFHPALLINPATPKPEADLRLSEQYLSMHSTSSHEVHIRSRSP